jgi:hypothetical protein
MLMSYLPHPFKEKIWFPIWQYLTQPLFSKASDTMFNPVEFWYRYRSQVLEHCWSLDPVQFLERCWHENCGSDRSCQL